MDSMTKGKTATPVTVHDSASPRPGVFEGGQAQVGAMKGSQSQYQRDTRDIAAGSGAQPAIHGQYPHPIPPNKGDRW